MMKPDDLKDRALQSPDGVAVGTPIQSITPMPSLEQVGALMVAVRDDVARATGIPVPEDVQLIAVKVIYKIHAEQIAENKLYTAVATRYLIDPFYENIVKDIL